MRCVMCDLGMLMCFLAHLRIVYICSFPALSCEFATLDVSDALGTVSEDLGRVHR